MKHAEAFYKFAGEVLHPNELEENTEYCLRFALRQLDAAEKAELREYLRYLLSEAFTDKQLCDLWFTTNAQLKFLKGAKGLFGVLLKWLDEEAKLGQRQQ